MDVLGNMAFWFLFFMFGFVGMMQIVKDFGSRFVARYLHIRVRSAVLTCLFVIVLLAVVRGLRLSGVTTTWTANAVRNGILIYTAARMRDRRLFYWLFGATILIFWPLNGPNGLPFFTFIAILLLLIPVNRYGEWLLETHLRRLGLLVVVGGVYWLFDWWVYGYELWETVLVYIVFVAVVMLAGGYDKLLNYRREAMNTLKYDTAHDALTGAGSRAKFTTDFSRYRRLAAAGKIPGVYLIMVDIDHFKQINDRYGHLAGDAVLMAFTKHLEDFLKVTDYPTTLYRTGGEEFSVLVTGGATCAVIKALMNAYQKNLRKLVVHTDAADIQITVSAGMTPVGVGDDEDAKTIARADAYLYAAKRAGRDTVVTGD